MSNLTTIKISEMDRVLRNVFRTGDPAFFWGEPGLGKTARVQAFCHRHDIELVTVILSYHDSATFYGWPLPSKEEIILGGEKFRIIHHAPPRWARQAAEASQDTEIEVETRDERTGRTSLEVQLRRGRRVLVFLDEYNTAAGRIQNLSLQFMHERICGELKLDRRRVFVCAAGNPADGGGVQHHDLVPAAANRLSHHHIVVDVKDWSDNFPTYWGADPEQIRMGSGYPGDESYQDDHVPDTTWARARTLMASYIKKVPDALHKFPSGDRSQQSAPWPSARTNEMVARLMAGAIHDKEPLDKIVPDARACIGVVAANTMHTWLREQNLPDPDELLRDPRSFDPAQYSGDQQWCIATQVAVMVAGDLTAERFKNAWTIMRIFAEQARVDIVVPAAHELAKLWAREEVKKGKGVKLPSAQELGRCLEPFAPTLEAAGYMKINRRVTARTS